MPTVITVPVGERTKSIKFGATYTPALSFNPDKKLFFGCSGVLTGMGVTVDTVPVPDEVTVDPGAFIQRGIIVDVTNPQLLQFPDPLPLLDLFLVAENPNEVFNSSVTYQFTTAPAADSVIIAKWATPITTTDFTTELKLGICELRDALDGVLNFVINRDRQVAAGGQMVFVLPAGKEYVLGSNKLSVYRNGKKLDVSADYMEDNPNQITLNFAAVAGDILEFIMFQSEPPITSIALNNLTDVTSDLANGIKDTLAIRTVPASAANPLITFADIPVAAVGKFQFEKHSVPVLVNTNVAADIVVPGTAVTFTLTVARDVLVQVTSGGFQHSINGSSGEAFIRITSPGPTVVDHRIGKVLGSDGGDTLVETGQCSGWVIVNLLAGVHTAEVFGSGGGNPAIQQPIQLVVLTGEPIP